MITFIECLREYQQKTGVQVSNNKAKLISYKIKTVWDKKDNPKPSYIGIIQDGKPMVVRQYPEKFKPTIMGIIHKCLKAKRSRVRKAIKKPVFSYKPKTK